MRTSCRISLLFLLVMAVPTTEASPNAPEATVWGSEASMARQHRVARDLDLTFVRSVADFSRMLGEGSLVALSGNGDYEVIAAYPFARPEIRLFIERLASQYRRATGEVLVVTSLARPTTRQPRNSHPLSVHPAGMAIDLRVSNSASARRWLENTLLELERAGVLDVTREKYPPHYHVAVFPDAYANYLEQRLGDVPLRDTAAVYSPPQPRSTDASSAPIQTVATADSEPFYASFLIDPTDREQMSLVAVLPLIGILIGALGFRRRSRLV